MSAVSLVFLPGIGLALEIRKSYQEPKFYYTGEDTVIRDYSGHVLDINNALWSFRYRSSSYWGRSTQHEHEKDREAARYLTDKISVEKGSVKDDFMTLTMVDPEYRMVLEKKRKAAAEEAKRAQAAEKRAAALTAKRTGKPAKAVAEIEPAYTPDPDDEKNWKIVLTLRNGRQESDSSCICEAKPCRHKTAVVEYLEAQEDLLKEAYIHSDNAPDKSLFVPDRISQMMLDCGQDDANLLSPERIELVKKTVEEISSVRSPEYFDAVLSELFSFEPGGWNSYDARMLEDLSPLIGGFYQDPYLRELLKDPDTVEKFLQGSIGRQTKSNIVTFKRELKQYQNAEKELEKDKGVASRHKELIVKYSRSPEQLLEYYVTKSSEFFDDDLKFLNLYLEQYEQLPPSFRTAILDLADQASNEYKELRDPLIPKLLRSFPPERQAVLLAHMQNYNLDLPSFKTLAPELQQQLAEYMVPDMETLRYLFNTVAKDYDDQKKADLILKMAKKVQLPFFRENSPGGELLLEEARKLAHHKLLELYLANRFNIEKSLPKENSLRLTKDDITSYFRTGFDVKDEKDEAQTHYYLYPAMTDPDEALEDMDFSNEDEDEDEPADNGALFHLVESNGRIFGRTFAERYLTQDSIKTIASLALEGRAEEHERKQQRIQEAIETRNFEKNHKHFASLYKNLCQDLQEEKIVLSDTFKVNLSYLFDFSGNDFLLSFKVGNTRDYIVKNANDFMQAFRTGETVAYGKDLVLTHDIENLKEEDRPIMRLLSPQHYRVVGSGPQAKRNMPLSGPLFSNVIEHLKGRTVTVVDQPALVRLDPVDIKLDIDKKFQLSVGYDPRTQKILSTGTKSYLYSANPGGIATIDRINADADQVKLIDFALQGGGVSIRPILNDFKRNIYSRYFDSFRVADSIRDQFRLSVIRINAYFDYEDKAVTVKTEYLKDDKKIPRSALTERMDLAKAEGFENSLASLGFDGSVLRDESGILSFLKMDFSSLKRQASIYLSENLSSKKLVGVKNQVIRISCSGSGIIDAVLEKSDYTEEELEQILQAMKRKKKFLLLSGDRIVDLDSKEAREFRDTVRDLGLEAGELYKKKRLSMVEAIKAFAHENSCTIDRQLRTMVDEIRSFKDYEAKVPKLSYEMRGYQEEGYRWLNVLSKYNMGGILADDMGLGKTLQVIALIKADKKKRPSLIVCPKSLVFNWVNEFAKFDGDTPVTEIYGLSEKRQDIIRGIDYNEKRVYVTSYDSLRNDISAYGGGTFNYCILDEAQYIKNVTAQKSRSAKEIKADHRFALTGTPIENNIIDLWSIFDYIMPGYFEDLPEFKASASQEEFHERVAKRIGPFVLRRVKEDVLSDLPAKYETILSCDMTPPQKKAYEAVRKKARDAMKADGKAFDLLPILMQMRQVCVDPVMCVDGYEGGSGKMQMLSELIPGYLEQGHRILIFSQFVKGLNQVEKLLKEQGIGYYMLTGETSAKERARMIDEFNSTNGTDVFLISLKAGGTGLNLTGADTVIHLDPWWNVAAENQATDRAHRIGQTRNVEVIKLISEQSIEQRVIELQNLKKDLIDRVISNDDSSVTGASLEDIAYILG